MEDVRIDKWLWAVRIFKTRSISTEECKKGKIIIDNTQVKPSRNVKINDIIKVRKNQVNYLFKVKGLVHNRISAKQTPDYYEDITPQEEKDKLVQKREHFFYYDSKGRPTKRDRRNLEEYTNNYFNDIEV